MNSQTGQKDVFNKVVQQNYSCEHDDLFKLNIKNVKSDDLITLKLVYIPSSINKNEFSHIILISMRSSDHILKCLFILSSELGK